MAQNLEKILRVLRSNPQGMCDDCLSLISGVMPRQTVNQICSVLCQKGKNDRSSRECPQCHKVKLVNVLQLQAESPPSEEPATLPATNVLSNYHHEMTQIIRRLQLQAESTLTFSEKSEMLQEQTNVLSNYHHEMTEIIRRLDASAPHHESLVAGVTRLRKEGVLPRKMADMMLTINAMRVEVVKDRSLLPMDEWTVAQLIWRVLDRWRRETWRKTNIA